MAAGYGIVEPGRIIGSAAGEFIRHKRRSGVVGAEIVAIAAGNAHGGLFTESGKTLAVRISMSCRPICFAGIILRVEAGVDYAFVGFLERIIAAVKKRIVGHSAIVCAAVLRTFGISCHVAHYTGIRIGHLGGCGTLER